MKLFTPWLALAGLLLLTALRPAQAQNVGIGTTTPTQTLDVNGNLRVRGLSGSGGGLPQVQPDGTLGLFSSPYSSAIDPYAAQPVLLNPNPAGGTSGGTTTDNSPNDVAVSGSMAYVVNENSNTLQVFDVSTPTSPVLRGTVGTDSNPINVAVSGSMAYVVNYDSNTLQVFDVSNPIRPVLRGTTKTGSNPRGVAVSGSMAYVVNENSNTLQVFDVSSPVKPGLNGTVNTGSNPVSVAVSGSTVYVVNYDSNTLQVFDVSTPRRPVLGHNIPTATGPISMVVSGGMAYVVNYTSRRLQVFDLGVNTGTKISLRGSVDTDIGPINVAVSGSTAYVVDYDIGKLQVFDVSQPNSPVLRGSVGTGRGPIGVAVNSSTAYVVNSSSNTLQAFQVSSVRAVGLAADGSLAIASPPTLSVSGQSLSISGGNAVTLPGDNLGNHTATQNLNLASYQLVGNGATQGVSVSSSGNVGIGTTTPLAALHVDGAEGNSTTAVGVTIGGGSNSNPNIELRSVGRTPYIDFAETSGVDFTTRLISQGGTLNVAYGGPAPQPTYLLKVNGGLQCTNLFQTSDTRLKTQVRPLTGALASVLALRGVRYRWNALGVQRGGTAGGEQVGLLAQELEQVYPELVSTDAQGYKAVNYAQLTPVLLEALKEQQAQIETLQAQVAGATQQVRQATAAQQADHADLQTLKTQLARLLGEPSQASAR